MDHEGLNRLTQFLTTSIHCEFGNEWEVGWYPDSEGPVVTVSCCRTPDEVTSVPLHKITSHVARQSHTVGYRLTLVDTHDSRRPIISFRAQ